MRGSILAIRLLVIESQVLICTGDIFVPPVRNDVVCVLCRLVVAEECLRIVEDVSLTLVLPLIDTPRCAETKCKPLNDMKLDDAALKRAIISQASRFVFNLKLGIDCNFRLCFQV